MAQKVMWAYRRPNYMPDLALAFQTLGWTTRLTSEREMMKEMLKGSYPDMVISNVAGQTLGSELPKDAYTVLSMTGEKKIPYVWLMWDSLMFDPALATLEQQAHAVSLGPPAIRPMVFPDGDNLYVFTVSKEAVPYLKGKHVEYMPFGVNTDRFRPIDTPKVYPVGFIGTSLIGSPNDGQTVMEALGLKSPLYLGDPATARTWDILCGVRKSAMDRIEACVSTKADVWGDGWQPVVSHGVTWHGPCSNVDMPKFINSCRVSLNVSKTCFPLDIAPRMLEILACDAPVVSNRLPGLETELNAVASFYDEPAGLLEAVAKAERRGGRDLILSGWTWGHRAKRILEVIGI